VRRVLSSPFQFFREVVARGPRLVATGSAIVLLAACSTLGISIQSAAPAGASPATQTWVAQTFPGDEAWNTSCPSVSDCFSAAGDIVATTNGGSSWAAQSAPNSVEFTTIDCPTTQVCYAEGQQFEIDPGFPIYTTNNGGASWTLTTGSVAFPNSMACTSIFQCVAVGQSGTSSTTNGGTTWTPESLPTGATTLEAAACSSNAVCYAVGGSTSGGGALFASSNGGATWTPQSLPFTVDALNGISCASSTACTAVGVNAIVSTDDGGVTWDTQPLPTGVGSLNAVSCPTGTICYAGGGDGSDHAIVVGSNDGGSTWTTQTLPSGMSWVASMSCPSSNSCFAGGENTADRGEMFNGTSPSTTPTCSGTGVGNPTLSVGYWMAGSNGAVYSCGDAPFYGSLVTLGVTPTHPIVGMAACPSGVGYWLAASDGGVFSFGLHGFPSGGYYGSMGGKPLNEPIVGMAATSDCLGYWLVASDGGIFSFGDAHFAGSTGSLTLNKPIVGMADSPFSPSPTAPGYWLAASDGGLFAFNVPFLGSTGCLTLNQPVVGIAVSSDTTTVGTNTACHTGALTAGGYWLVASDGGVFSFGNSHFLGSTGCLTLNQPVVGMAVSPDASTVGSNTACDASLLPAGGYWMDAADGGVFSFGNAQFAGSLPGSGINVDDVVDMVVT
jgi:photosystem II stability/assembly factor-like uncharacterized protein